jgi:hypothetical protein
MVSNRFFALLSIHQLNPPSHDLALLRPQAHSKTFGFNPSHCAVQLSEYPNLGCIYRIRTLTFILLRVS